MAYSYKKLEDDEIGKGEPVYKNCSCCTDPLDQFEILDSQAERITIVYDEAGAQGLVSHLNRGEKPEEKPMKIFTLWVEGYSATGQSSTAQCLGSISGTDFNDAVKNYVEKLPTDARSYWSFRDNSWLQWGCRAYDNETAARRSFG